jgi:hypothetical protein
MITVELWRNGMPVGSLQKPNRAAAVRTAWLFSHTSDLHAIIVAPRSAQERFSMDKGQEVFV